MSNFDETLWQDLSFEELEDKAKKDPNCIWHLAIKYKNIKREGYTKEEQSIKEHILMSELIYFSYKDLLDKEVLYDVSIYFMELSLKRLKQAEERGSQKAIERIPYLKKAIHLN